MFKTLKKKTKVFKSRLTKKGVLFVVVILGLAFVFMRGKKEDEFSETFVQKGQVKETLVLSGEVSADLYAALTFASVGKIDYIAVNEGDQVYKGQLLAKLDLDSSNADYQIARSNLRDKEAALEKVYDDLKNKETTETFAEKQTRTTAEVAKDNAYETFIKAQESLRNASIYAPFAGYVTFVANSTPGINILPTQTQIELIDPKSIYFEVDTDQSEVIKIEEGFSVSIILDSFADQELKGVVDFIALTPKTLEAGTVYAVKIKFEDLPENFSARVGMTGDVTFVLNQKDNTLFLPSEFVNSDKDGDYVYLNSPKNKVYVTTGLIGEEFTEITSGLSEGDRVLD